MRPDAYPPPRILATLRYAGRVGCPGPGERICSRCRGAGRAAADGPGPFSGCERCDGTGVTKVRKGKPS